MVAAGETTIVFKVDPPGDHKVLVWPHPPVMLLTLRVAVPGAQNTDGVATTLKFKGTKTPGTTNELGVVHGPTVFVPLTHSRAEKK